MRLGISDAEDIVSMFSWLMVDVSDEVTTSLTVTKSDGVIRSPANDSAEKEDAENQFTTLARGECVGVLETGIC